MKNKNNFQNNINYIQYTEPNLFNRSNYFLQNNKKQIKTHNNTKNLNRFRSATKINNNRNRINYLNHHFYSPKADIFDMRIYFCLKMLGLSHLQNIFEKNKINFDELLILSMKDLDMLFIQKNDQIKIKKFSLDYIKNASYYSLDELENYFINKKNMNNYRKAISVRNMREKNMNINHMMNNNNFINENINQLNPNIYRNYKKQEIFSSNSNYYNKNNIRNNIYKHTDKNANYNYKDFINGIYSNKNYLNGNFNGSNKKSNDYYNYDCNNFSSTYSGNKDYFYNEEMVQRQNNYLLTNKLNKYLNQTNVHDNIHDNKINKDKKMKELSDKQKKIVNNIFSNRINSIKNKKNNKNIYTNNSINNAQFLNEKEYNMFSEIQKMKKNKSNNKNLIKQKISNKNITNTKINNYINNIYNINKNIQENKLKKNIGNSYRNKLLNQNEMSGSKKKFLNKNEMMVRNITSSNKKQNINDPGFGDKINNNYNYYLNNNRERNLTLSNENRNKNLTYKNSIMLNNNNNKGYPSNKNTNNVY